MRPTVVVLLLLSATVAAAAPGNSDRKPIAILWAGAVPLPQPADAALAKVASALERSSIARPIDGGQNREVLATGAIGAALGSIAEADCAFVALDYARAARLYEVAEQNVLGGDLPVKAATPLLHGIEQHLLMCYQQLHETEAAARAATRLGWGGELPVGAQRTPIDIASEPAGAFVYRNFRFLGKTPLAVENGDGINDVLSVELAGYRGIHVVLGAGLPQIVLEPEQRLGGLVEAVRQTMPNVSIEIAGTVAQQVGAARVLIVAEQNHEVVANYFDAAKTSWAAAPFRTSIDDMQLGEKLIAFVVPDALVKRLAAGPAPLPPQKSGLGMWGKWYTWVTAGAVAAVVGGLIIAEHVGDDKLTLTASH